MDLLSCTFLAISSASMSFPGAPLSYHWLAVLMTFHVVTSAGLSSSHWWISCLALSLQSARPLCHFLEHHWAIRGLLYSWPSMLSEVLVEPHWAIPDWLYSWPSMLAEVLVEPHWAIRGWLYSWPSMLSEVLVEHHWAIRGLLYSWPSMLSEVLVEPHWAIPDWLYSWPSMLSEVLVEPIELSVAGCTHDLQCCQKCWWSPIELSVAGRGWKQCAVFPVLQQESGALLHGLRKDRSTFDLKVDRSVLGMIQRKPAFFSDEFISVLFIVTEMCLT